MTVRERLVRDTRAFVALVPAGLAAFALTGAVVSLYC
jgi:hypothetical protein